MDNLLGMRQNTQRYRTDSKTFDDSFDTLRDNTYIEGFFQAERYFAGVGPLLRQHFSFPYPMLRKRPRWLNGFNQALRLRFIFGEAIMRGIRRRCGISEYWVPTTTSGRSPACAKSFPMP